MRGHRTPRCPGLDLLWSFRLLIQGAFPEQHIGVCLLHGRLVVVGRHTVVCLLRETSGSVCADQPRAMSIAGIIGTFGLTVKLGSATFEFLFSMLPKSTKSIGGAPRRRRCAAFVGTTSFPLFSRVDRCRTGLNCLK